TCAARDLLAVLAEKHGEPLRRLLLGGAVLVFVNNSQVAEEAEPLQDGDVVTMLSPIAGGEGPCVRRKRSATPTASATSGRRGGRGGGGCGCGASARRGSGA